jgi:addiction module HigA family antidote
MMRFRTSFESRDDDGDKVEIAEYDQEENVPRRPQKRALIHPGEVLLKEYLNPLGISQYRLAKDTSVPPRRINEIVRGTRGITADTALRLARHFGTTERFWMNMQAHYDLEVEKERLAGRLEREVKVRETRTDGEGL